MFYIYHATINQLEYHYWLIKVMVRLWFMNIFQNLIYKWLQNNAFKAEPQEQLLFVVLLI